MTARTWACVGCRPRSVTSQVAPAFAQGVGVIVWGNADDQVERLASRTGSADLAGQLCQGGRIWQSGGEQAIPLQRPAYRAPVGPLRSDPDRDPWLLQRHRLEAARPVPGQVGQAAIEQLRSFARVGDLAEGFQLAVSRAA